MAESNTTKPGSLVQMKKQLEASKPSKKGSSQQRSQRPNYHQIHSKPLPLATYPLPAFIAQNPLSYIRILYATISHYLFPPSSHAEIFHGYFDPLTRSIHVTDIRSVRALWEMGFFGKGSLSRSEPTWLDQEKKRLGLIATSTSEQYTEQRRVERERMKRERARIEQEALQDQINKEKGIVPEQTKDVELDESSNTTLSDSTPLLPREATNVLTSSISPRETGSSIVDDTVFSLPETEVTNEEHLQLSLEEAFFLTYALGALRLTELSLTNAALFSLFRQNSYFPAVPSSKLSPDDPFLLNYVVYHHYRSLGWVIREGLKFAVDYLLYESGPVFKHAAFAIMIVPSYSKAYWKQDGLEKTATQRRKGAKDWTWMHCVNRVQTQVLKTMVLCYVDVASPLEIEGQDVGTILAKYKIREFSISRWSLNRNRD
jgi:tRNA-splicing endonuclease subunit Sen2